MFHYHPFGWEISDRSFSSDKYCFGFNGKENDSDYGNQLIQDYGFRLYNPAIAKFLSVAPLSPEYPWNSTYAFAENNSIKFIDLDGLERFDPQAKPVGITTIEYATISSGDMSKSSIKAGGYNLYGVNPTSSDAGSYWIARKEFSDGSYRHDYIIGPASVKRFRKGVAFYEPYGDAGMPSKQQSTRSIWRDWDKPYLENVREWGHALGGNPEGSLGQAYLDVVSDPMTWLSAATIIALRNSGDPLINRANRVRYKGKTGAATETTTIDGSKYYTLNGSRAKGPHSRKITGELIDTRRTKNLLEHEKVFCGNCVEIGGMEQVVKNGKTLKGATQRTVQVGDTKSQHKHGEIKPACTTCNHMQEKLGIEKVNK
ncbi:MAG: RHS repeat-associated core domain-containing protein [Aureispira sp.]